MSNPQTLEIAAEKLRQRVVELATKGPRGTIERNDAFGPAVWWPFEWLVEALRDHGRRERVDEHKMCCAVCLMGNVWCHRIRELEDDDG
jgi:hypothetical protein